HDTPDYVARARALGPALAGVADEIERNRELPASLVSALIDNGMFRLLQPRFLGGAELDPMTYIQVVEQIASHDASTAWCVEQANGCSMVAAFLDPEVAREIFGPLDGIVRLDRPSCQAPPVGSGSAAPGISPAAATMRVGSAPMSWRATPTAYRCAARMAA